MAIIQGLEWTFNTVAEEYDKWSPEYVPELYADLFAYQPLTSDSEVLEIGIGTGQATTPILKTGCRLTAVELGDQLAALTRKKFSDYPDFTVVTSAFQDYESPENRFDLIYSAAAFHWIPEEIGYPKVYAEIQKVYAQYMAYSAPTPPFTEADAKRRSEISLRYGFVDQKIRMYSRKRSYSAQDYVSLIATQSDHIILDKTLRADFYAAIQNKIECFGGRIELVDTIDLELARKP